MDRRKESTADAHPQELSWDIVLFHILPRLPVKSIFRFRSVSKEWHSLITMSALVKMHLHHANITNNKRVVLLSTTTTPYKFHTLDCETPKQGISVGRPLPFKVGPWQLIRILTSAHGLVCIGIFQYGNGPYNNRYIYSDLILWNPATGDHKTLSKPETYEDRGYCYKRGEESLFGLYHSSCDDDYKLLRVTTSCNSLVYIYSLKSDSWRKVVNSEFQRTTIYFSLAAFMWWGPNIWLNENLYILKHNRSEYSYSIIRFNTKTETFKVIPPLFLGNDQRSSTWLSFTVDDKKRCIEFWVNIENSENELWRMEGDGEGDGDWTKVANSGMIPSDHVPVRFQERLHLMRNGNMLMYDGRCIYQLDMKTHTKHVCSYTNEEMYVRPGGIYTETMVSPNQYMIDHQVIN